MFLFLINIIFWSLIYLIDSLNLSKVYNIIKLSNSSDYYKSSKNSSAYFTSKLLLYFLFHLLFAVTVYLLTQSIFLAIGQLLLSFSVKFLIRGFSLSVFLDISFYELTNETKIDFYGSLLSYLHKHFKISPLLVMVLQFIIVLLYLLFFNIL